MDSYICLGTLVTAIVIARGGREAACWPPLGIPGRLQGTPSLFVNIDDDRLHRRMN